MAIKKDKKGVYSATLRIPTAAKYAFIEMQASGTVEEIVDAYYQLGEEYWRRNKAASKPSQG